MTPEHEALREAVARALWMARNPPYPFENVSGDELIDLLAEADAALAVVREALREPTPAMIFEAVEWRQGDGSVEDIWRAMFAKSALGGPRDE